MIVTPLFRPISLIAAAACLMLTAAAAADAQTPPLPRAPGPNDSRMRLGPLLLNPRISLANLGIDDNVFNDPDAQNPESDFTITVTPETEWWLPMGRTWLAGMVREDFVWYRTFDSESSANGRYGVGWVAPLTRITFAAGGNWISARERPGFEIDTRPHRTETAWNGAVELRAFPKTFLGVRAQRRVVDFDADAVYLTRNLRTELNRTEDLAAVTVRHELTPLTSVSLEAGRAIDNFEFRTIRSTESTRVRARLDFDPVALISGSVQVGYRSFRPDSPDVPEFDGATAAVSLTYVALGSTRLTVAANRDVEYSFNTDRPYYLLTAVSGSVAQRIYGPVDVEARIAHQDLAYRARIGAAGVEFPSRTDSVRSFGGGVGYRLGRDLRIGVNLDQQKRTSDVALRGYEALRFGLSVTYGL